MASPWHPYSGRDADLVEDIDWIILTGGTIESALQRCGVSARTAVRAYKHLGRIVPDGLWAADRQVMA